MGTRTAPGRYDCVARAADDEPVFALIARDRQFGMLVLRWAFNRLGEMLAGARRYDEAEIDQIAEALAVADAAIAWRRGHRRQPDPLPPPLRAEARDRIERIRDELHSLLTQPTFGAMSL